MPCAFWIDSLRCRDCLLSVQRRKNRWRMFPDCLFRFPFFEYFSFCKSPTNTVASRRLSVYLSYHKNANARLRNEIQFFVSFHPIRDPAHTVISHSDPSLGHTHTSEAPRMQVPNAE